MKGIVDVITTDGYEVNVPDDVFEQVKADMAKEFEDWEALRDGDNEELYNIFLNWHGASYYTRKDKQNEYINKSALRYALYYKDRYGLDAPQRSHHISFKTELSI